MDSTNSNKKNSNQLENILSKDGLSIGITDECTCGIGKMTAPHLPQD